MRRKTGERKEGMVGVSSLFEKYKNILRAPEKTTINAFIEVLDDLYGWNIKEEMVSYNPGNRIISLNTSGALKTEIKLNKKEILTHLKGRLGSKSCPKDIF